MTSTTKKDTIHALSRLGETKEVVRYMNSTDGQEVDAHNLFQTTPLVWGARNGHDETVKYLSSIKADVNATGFGGWSALQHAVSCSCETMVTLLLRHDANPNASDETGTRALHVAAARGAINIVARLIESHADVNAQNAAGTRPLHYGALFGHVSSLKTLAEHDADINAQDTDGNTALHLAAQMGFENAVQFLLSVCNKRIVNKEGKLPLNMAQSSLIRNLLK